MSKKTKTPTGKGRKPRRRGLGRASVALTTVMTAGIALAPTGAHAALTTGPDKAAYSPTAGEGTATALRDILRGDPKSETAKAAFVQLAALCGGQGTEGRDPDCTGSITATSESESPSGDHDGPSQIY